MILVTGSTGFLGSALCEKLMQNNISFRCAVRKLNDHYSGDEYTEVGDINSNTNWSIALYKIDCVIHCAARTHVMRETKSNSLPVYRTINVDGTKKLAEQAAKYGVKRFIYLSSIKVNGEQTQGISKYKSEDTPMPQDPYGISKWEAEQVLQDIAARTGLEVVIIRSPLVYGSEVKGNFLSMLKWINRGIPLPFGAINNKRSLVAKDNLINLIIRCIDHPAAKNKTFLVSDDEDLSTTELLQRIGFALGKPARLIPLPASFLHMSGILLGKKNITDRLLGNLQVDIAFTKQVLGWRPLISVNEGLNDTVKWYLSNQ